MLNQPVPSSGPWWRYGHVWLVLAGPALVVVASFITFYIAVTRPDPVVAVDYYRQGIEINQRQAGTAPPPASLAPAIQARNHAATGLAPQAPSDTKP